MPSVGNYVWIASYPKSGNTWFRTFVANYTTNRSEPCDINRLSDTPIASARLPLELASGFRSSLFSDFESDFLRREYYECRNPGLNTIEFTKVHDAYTILRDGRPLFPGEITRCAIYIVRNPLDVCVSFAHYNDSSVEQAASMMCRRGYAMASGKLAPSDQFRQILLTWSGHVQSWRSAHGIKCHVLRYEDMKSDPLNTFSRACEAIGLPLDQDRIARAIEFSRFEQLQQQEKENGFRERPSNRPFFRSGQSNSWRTQLPSPVAKRIVDEHGAVMHELGYSKLVEEVLALP